MLLLVLRMFGSTGQILARFMKPIVSGSTGVSLTFSIRFPKLLPFLFSKFG